MLRSCYLLVEKSSKCEGATQVRNQQMKLILTGTGSFWFVLFACTGQKQDSAREVDFEWQYPSFTVSETGRVQLSIDGTITPEIIAWDKANNRLLALSQTGDQVLTLSSSLEDTTQLINLRSDSLGVPTSISVRNDGVIAVTRSHASELGVVQLFDAGGVLVDTVEVGNQPDQVLSHNDAFVVINEGEASVQESHVPGGISILTEEDGLWIASNIDFETSLSRDEWNANGGHAVLDEASMSEEVEPEYATLVYENDALTEKLWITLQEANSIISFNLATMSWGDPIGLGAQDHLMTENNIDASDEDEEQTYKPWPVLGLHQPDGIAHFSKEGTPYLITANEGEPLRLADSIELMRVKELVLDETAFPNADNLERKKKLGRLKVSSLRGDTDQDGDMDVLYSFGSRSISIWDVDNRTEVYNSGNSLSAYLNAEWGIFNPNNTSNAMDQSSDDSGIAPESVVVGMVANHPVAFVAFEQAGGVIVLSLDQPKNPEILQYLPSRNFSLETDFDSTLEDVDYSLTGGLAPEGMVFVDAEQSPNGKPMLFVAYEQSGHIMQYTIEVSS